MTATARTVVHFTDASMFGGAEQMIVNLLSGLDRRRWNPVVLHHGEPRLGELIERLREIDVPSAEVARPNGRRAIGRFLRDVRPAIFHAHLNWPLACSDGIIAAALARTPGVVATQQLFSPIRSRRWMLRQKFVSAAVDRYIAVSHDMARMLRKACLFGASKVRVVHNGISTTPFERRGRPDARENLLGRGDRPVVLTLARLAPQKGIRYLVEAAARVPEALFAVAGDGPERGALQEQAAAAGLEERMLFLGHRTDVPDLLAACDVFVLPSLYEGLPVSVLEAMASGRPVVATRIGGTDEAVEDEVTGLLVPPADAGALAAAIRRLLADRLLARRLSESARDRVHGEFSSRVVADRTMDVYEELTG
jgi:glycosyltransferase involved in cell wall biosynthesis